MTTRGKQILKFVAKLAVTSALLVLVFSRIDLQQFWQAVRTARWQFLIAVWALTILFFWINSIKMQLILKKQGCYVSVNRIFGATAITLLYSMVVPGTLSTGVKWYILRKDTGKGTNVFSSMVYNQLSIIVVMTASGLVALMVTNPALLLSTTPQHQWLLPAVCGVLLSVIVLTTLLLLNRHTGVKISSNLGLLLRPLPERIRQKGLKILEQIAVFQTIGWKFHLTIASFIVATSLVIAVFIYILAAKAANIKIAEPLTVGVLIWLCAIVYILERIPISVANLGVREFTLVEILALYKVDASSALLMSMILFSLTILMAIIGAVFQLLWVLKRPKQKR